MEIMEKCIVYRWECSSLSLLWDPFQQTPPSSPPLLLLPFPPPPLPPLHLFTCLIYSDLPFSIFIYIILCFSFSLLSCLSIFWSPLSHFSNISFFFHSPYPTIPLLPPISSKFFVFNISSQISFSLAKDDLLIKGWHMQSIP